jgi:splicing factor 3B subunit 1
VLFEQLGEEYPDTLGSIIAAEGAIANVVGMTQMNPPVKDLREYLTKFQRIVWFSNIIYTSSSNDSHST